MICNATNNETVNTEKQCSDVNRLSELQKQVLVSLWKELRSIERDFEAEDRPSRFGSGRRGWWFNEFGGGGCRPLIGWRWQVVFNTPPTRSQCAALSRALRRLEQRGLVDRTNINTGSTHTGPLGVTNLGRVVASTLAGETDPYPTLRDWVKVSPGSLTPEELEARINDPHKRFG
jgi:hypothetical protein